MQTAAYIADLLYEHDCVIIPGFGGFVGQYVPAQLDEARHRFSPPSKRISFNQNLQDNDGLLAHYVSQKEEIPFPAALAKLADLRQELEATLNEKRNVTIPGVGTLYRDRHDRVRFERDKSSNFRLDAFGLEPVFSRPLTLPEPETVPAVRQDLPSVPPAKKRRRAVVYVPLTLLLALLLGYGLWVSLSTDFWDGGDLNYAALNPFSDPVCADYQARDASPVLEQYELEAVVAAMLNVPDSVAYLTMPSLFAPEEPHYDPGKKIVVAWNPAAVAPKRPKAVEQLRDLRYHVVGGCFSIRENAEKMVNVLQAQGFAAHIVDQRKGLFRVSISSYATRREAVERLQAVKTEDHPYAWLLVK